MVSDVITLTFVIILGLIPGVVCEYDNDVSRMIAVSVVGFFLLIAIIVMIMLATLWRDWWERRQAARGRRRVERSDWTLFHRKYKQSAVSTPVSQKRKLILVQSGSTQNLKTAEDSFVTKPVNVVQLEEKSKSIDFGLEDEAMIVTEVLPGNQQQVNGDARAYRVTTTPAQTHTQTTNYVQQTNAQTTNYVQQTNGQMANYETEDGTFYVPLKGGSRTQTDVRGQPDVRTRGQSYHVHMSQGPPRQSEEIIINPMVPQTSAENAVPVNPAGATYVFRDSDDEAGNISNQRDDQVLF